MTDTEQPHTNGIDTVVEEEDSNKVRPADIEAVSFHLLFFFIYFFLTSQLIR